MDPFFRACEYLTGTIDIGQRGMLCVSREGEQDVLAFTIQPKDLEGGIFIILEKVTLDAIVIVFFCYKFLIQNVVDEMILGDGVETWIVEVVFAIEHAVSVAKLATGFAFRIRILDREPTGNLSTFGKEGCGFLDHFTRYV